MAQLVARRSYDPHHQVGAVVVSGDNTQVLAVGYNGNYAGGPHRRDSEATGESGFIHAEVNALLKLDYRHPGAKVMYVTMSPCTMCAKAIVNAGIDAVYYGELYQADQRGLAILDEVGITTQRYSV